MLTEIMSSTAYDFSHSKIFRNRPELLQDIKLDSPDAKELLSNLRRTCLVEENIERLWTPQSIHLVQNAELQKNYEQRRKEMKENGRKGKEIEDKTVFVAETWAGVQKICKFGIRCLEKKRQILGDTKHGVHLNRHFDLLLRFMAFQNVNKFRYVVVFKAMFGRTKAVTAKLNEDQQTIEPIPNCDSHISSIKPDIQMDIFESLDHNYIYLYEYDEETSYPVQFPRQILPYAVIQLTRTQCSIDRPLKWGGSKRTSKKNSNSSQTTQRKTWNSRVAAYNAAVASESLKENISVVSDTNNGDTLKFEEDVDVVKHTDTEGILTELDMKPCKIELFRSDMDIDERVKVSSNFEFDTASGTNLVATDTGFVKYPHPGSEIQKPSEAGETIFVTVYDQSHSNEIGQRISDSTDFPNLSHIKQEPVDSGVLYQTSDSRKNENGDFSINVKCETTESEYENSIRKGEHLQNIRENVTQSSSHSSNTITSNKQVLLKRLEQVEREIHWKKQKIDELQKQSSSSDATDTHEKKPRENIDSSEKVCMKNNLETEANYEMKDLCLAQNEKLRSLSVNMPREHAHKESEEGDSTPTLDEPVDGLWTNIDVQDKTPVFNTEGSQKSPPRSAENISERKNIFDAYSNTTSFLVKSWKDINTNSVSTSSPSQTVASPVFRNMEVPLQSVSYSGNGVAENVSFNCNNSEKPSVFPDKIVPQVESNISLKTSPMESDESKSYSNQPKHSPLDVFKIEKKCSPFLAKYLEKRLSIGSLDDTTTKNQSSPTDRMASTSDLSGKIYDARTLIPTSLNVTSLLEKQTNDQSDSMPTLSPITTQSEDFKPFNLSAAFANIKKIMETGELNSDSSPERLSTEQYKKPNLKDPRIVREVDESKLTDKTDSTAVVCKTNNEETLTEIKKEKIVSSADSGAGNSTVKPKWLPGVLINDYQDTKDEEAKTDPQSELLPPQTKVERSNDIADNDGLPNEESFKTELSQNVHEEMQITLQKLGDAIKMIQSRCGSDEESTSVKTPTIVTNTSGTFDFESDYQNNESLKNASNVPDSANKIDDFEENNTYVGKSDIERTNRVLNDVFNNDMPDASSENQQSSTFITNIQEIKTVSTTDSEIKTQYTGIMDSTYYNGFDATAYSAIVAKEKEAIGHRIPVKLSGMGMRRPYTKWAENFRLKAMERQKRLYKSKLVRRFGFDSMKRTRDSEKKGKFEERRNQDVLRKGDRKRRTRSRSVSKERHHSLNDSFVNRSQSQSKFNRIPSPTCNRKNNTYDSKSPRRQSRDHSNDRKSRRSESQSDRCSSPKRSRKDGTSPIRDKTFLSFKERGIIMFKLKKGLKLSFSERQKYFQNRHKFTTSRALLSKALKWDRTLSFKRNFVKKEDRQNKFGFKNRNFNVSAKVPKGKRPNISFGQFSNSQHKAKKYDVSPEQTRTAFSGYQRFNKPDKFGKYSTSRDNRDSTYKSKMQSGYQRYSQSSSKVNNYRERDELNGKYDKNYTNRTGTHRDLKRDVRDYGRTDSRSYNSRLLSRSSEDRYSRRSHDEKNCDNVESSTEKTLSKAMTSLLSKIIQGDSAETVDNTTEGQMASMIYQLMKQKVQHETVNTLSQANMYAVPDRPFNNFAGKKPGMDIQSSLIDYQLSRQQNNVYQSSGSDSFNSGRFQYRDHSSSSGSYQSERNASVKDFRYQDKNRSRDNGDFYSIKADSSNPRSYKSHNTSHSNFRYNGGRGFPNSRRFQQRGSFQSEYNNQTERDRYQGSDSNREGRQFRHSSTSSSSSSASRNESRDRSDRNFKSR